MSARQSLGDVDPFLDAICDAPDDDAPRLIFADRLEERGESERAEFIRLQCLAASTDDDETRWAADARSWQIRRVLGRRLLDGPGQADLGGRFHRGFLASAWEHEPDAWSYAPIRVIRDRCQGRDPSSWWTSLRPGLVTGLDLSNSHLKSTYDVIEALRSPAGLSVRQLRLPPDHDLCRELPPWVGFLGGYSTEDLASIRELTISGRAFVGPNRRRWLVEIGECFRGLIALAIQGIHQNELSNSRTDVESSLIVAPWIDRLESLDLFNLPYAWEGLLRSRRATRLRRLRTSFFDPAPDYPDDWRAWSHLESVRILRDMPAGHPPELPAFERLVAGLASLPSLRSLDLAGDFQPEHLDMLCRSGGFPALRALRLDGGSLQSVRPLDAARWMCQLQELWISGFQHAGKVAGIAEWANNPQCSRLRRLGLKGSAWSADQVEQLVASPWLRRLIVLDLSNARLDAEAIQVLASERLPDLATLTLSPPLIDRMTSDRLQSRRGPALDAVIDRSRWWDYPPAGPRGDPRTPWEELA